MKLLLLITTTLFAISGWSQTRQQPTIKGYIIDKESNAPLPNASITLLNASDSSLVANEYSNINGAFRIAAKESGSYILHIRYLGYETHLIPIQVLSQHNELNLDTISLVKTGVTLGMVEIKENKLPVIIKKDTIEYNADYYKTREHALMEELLKRLPGVQVEPDGSIKVNGETVEKILLEGRPFFGDDIKMTTQNLSADMVDKVQLIDRKAERQFGSNNYGRTEKVINITIKKEKKDNLLGKAAVGYGTAARFAANGSISQFKDNGHLAFIGSANNVNNAGFLDGTGAERGGNGITENWKAGGNYSRDFNEKLKVNGSYAINRNEFSNQLKSIRQNIFQDSTYYYHRNADWLNNATSHYLNTELELNVDTMHQLLMSINLSHNSGNSRQQTMYKSVNEEQKVGNEGIMNSSSSVATMRMYAFLTFKKQFKKKGRVLNTRVNFIYNPDEQENYNWSHNSFIQPGGEIIRDTINQFNEIDNRNKLLQFQAQYTEPLFKNHFANIAYLYSRDWSTSDKFTYDFNASKGVYDRVNDSLSNSFASIYSFHNVLINLRGENNKYDYGIGMNMQASTLENNNKSRREMLLWEELDFYPSAFFNYNMGNNSQLRFTYSGSLRRPSAEQLQPVPDNSNPLYIQLGNPDLKMAFNHNLGIRYKGVSSRLNMLMAGLTTNIVTGKIINTTRMDSLGRQLSMPLNVSGAYSVAMDIASTFQLEELHTGINTNTAIIFSRDINFVNGVKGNVNNTGIRQEFSFSYHHKDLFDFSTAVGISYNNVKYSIYKGNNTSYFTYSFLLNGNINLPLGFIVGSSCDYVLNTGRAEEFSLNRMLLNAFISKSLFKNNQGLLKLQGFDLLKQNSSIARNVGENYIEDSQSRVLQRFFLLSFTYFIKPSTGKK